MAVNPDTGEISFEASWAGIDRATGVESEDKLRLDSVNYSLQQGFDPSVAQVSWTIPWPVVSADELTKATKVSEEPTSGGGAMEGEGADSAEPSEGIVLDEEQMVAALRDYLNGIPRLGILRWSDGVTEMSITLAIMDTPTIRRGTGAFRVDATIYDRRWFFKYGQRDHQERVIHYNKRDADGNILDTPYRKTVEQLIYDWLYALDWDVPPRMEIKIAWFSGAVGSSIWWVAGTRPIVAGIETDAYYPEVVMDEARPVSVIQDWLDMFGMRANMNPVTGALEICKRDALLTVNEVLAVWGVLEFPYDMKEVTPILVPRPEWIEVVGAEMEAEKELELEAVALDTDGKIKLLPAIGVPGSADYASYGYTGVQDGKFVHLDEDGDKRKPADQSGFQWYRIKEPIAFVDASGNALSLYRDDYEVLDKLTTTETYVEGSTNVERPRLDFAFGAHWMERGSGYGRNTGSDEQVETPYQIDSDRKLVKFQDPVYKQDATKNWVPCTDLKLHCVIRVKGRRYSYFPGYVDEFITNAPGAPRYMKEFIRDETLVARRNLAGTIIDEAELQAKAITIYNEYINRFRPTERGLVRYIGNLPLSTDPAIHEVTWTLDENGSFTQVGVHIETSPISPRYEERAAMLKTKAKVVDAPWTKTNPYTTTPQIRMVDR